VDRCGHGERHIRLFLDRYVIEETQLGEKSSASSPVAQDRRQQTLATTLKSLTKQRSVDVGADRPTNQSADAGADRRPVKGSGGDAADNPANASPDEGAVNHAIMLRAAVGPMRAAGQGDAKHHNCSDLLHPHSPATP
jgi:hypothetical protein